MFSGSSSVDRSPKETRKRKENVYLSVAKIESEVYKNDLWNAVNCLNNNLFSSCHQLDESGGEEPQEQMDSNRFLHRCDSCYYSTQSYSTMKEHQKKHSRNEAFRCPRCTYSAKRQQDIDRHLKMDHPTPKRHLGPMSKRRKTVNHWKSSVWEQNGAEIQAKRG